MQPVSIKSCIKRTLKGLGLQEAYRRHRALSLWEKVCGKEVAAVTMAESIKSGVLFVATKDHIWAAELSNFTLKFTERFNRLLGREMVRKIRFAPKPTLFVKDKKKKKSEYDPQSAELSKKDEKKVQEWTKDLKDEKARALVQKLLAEKFKYESWMKKHGAAQCFKCGVLIEKGRSFCFFCTLEMEENNVKLLGEAIEETPWITFQEAAQKITPLSFSVFRDVKDRIVNALHKEIVGLMETAGKSRERETKSKIVTLAMMKAEKKPAELKDEVLIENLSPFMYEYYKG